MPLLTSPIDGSPMRQIQRFGIELDVCPTSGGVWLDRGELEKLMDLMKRAAAEEASYGGGDSRRYRDDDDDRYETRNHAPRRPDYDSDYRHGHHKPYKKKSALSQMMEVFDF